MFKRRETSDPTCKLLSWDYPVKHSCSRNLSISVCCRSSQGLLELMQMWNAMKSAEHLEHIINMQTSCWRMQLPHVSIHCLHLHAELLHCTRAGFHITGDKCFRRATECTLSTGSDKVLAGSDGGSVFPGWRKYEQNKNKPGDWRKTFIHFKDTTEKTPNVLD